MKYFFGIGSKVRWWFTFSDQYPAEEGAKIIIAMIRKFGFAEGRCLPKPHGFRIHIINFLYICRVASQLFLILIVSFFVVWFILFHELVEVVTLILC